MGLDSVELIMRIEDAFEIHLPDAELQNLYTVADLHRLVLAKLEEPETEQTLLNCAFYRVRNSLVSAGIRDRRAIRPSTPLAVLFPRPSRIEAWERLRGALNLEVPVLSRPLLSGTVEFPDGMETVGDLCKYVLASNHGRIMKERRSRGHSNEVFETIAAMIHRQVSIPRSEIQADSHLWNDLAID